MDLKGNEGEDPHEHMLVSLEKRMVKEINGDYYDERWEVAERILKVTKKSGNRGSSSK